MYIYLIWFFVSVIVFFGTLKSDKKTQQKVATIFLFLLGCFVGLGDMLGGYDRYIYGELFDEMADANRMGQNPWLTSAFHAYATEFGYGTMSALISYLTANRYIFIFIITITIYLLLIKSISRYVDNVPFAVVIFMGLWFFFTFTYLRQIIGCTIAWLSIESIVQRNFKKFLLVLFIAFSFHNSAIIFLPIYFIPFKKMSPKTVLLIMAAALVMGLSPLPQAIFSAYGEIDSGRIIDRGYEADAGFRWAYLIEAIFFLYVILKNYKKVSDKPMDVLMLNIALIFCAILLIFVRSENGGRLGWLFMIGLICTMSNICVKNRKLLRQGVLMLAVSFFLFYRILNLWSFNMCPYKTFLTPGHTGAEWVYSKYEYDGNYDTDKFYRR